MDFPASLWASPTVQAALARDDVGTVIRLARRAADLNQSELGVRCGYSASTISRIERGQPPGQDIHVRRRIAEALNIPGPLLGLAAAGEHRGIDTPRAGNHATGPRGVRVGANPGGGGDPVRRRDLLSGLAATAAATAWPRPAQAATAPASLAELLIGTDTTAPPTSVDTLTRWLSAARSAFADCRYDELAARLTTFVASAAATRDQETGRSREHATVLLAGGYRLASELCVKRNDDALGWVLADRALTTARASGQPRCVAHASRSVAIAMRRAGHHRDAVALLSTTAEDLRTAGSDTDLATYGSLLCTAAYASAQHGDRGQAVTLVTEAADAARRLTAAVDAGDLAFSTTTVTVYKIGIFTALGDSAAALRYAADVDVHNLSTSERYARFCLDIARAWEQHGRPDRATQALHAAERCAPEELRRPSSHELITRLLYAPTLTPSGLRTLALRVGAVH